MQPTSGSLKEWLVPLGFILCAGWLTWHMPAFILDWAPPSDASQFDKLSALFKRIDVTPDMAGLFGGFADAVLGRALLSGRVVVHPDASAACAAAKRLLAMARHFHRLDAFPETAAWYERITSRPGFEAALPPEGAERLYERDFYEAWDEPRG